jgi:2-polyprenyl-6-hydroxyphenyl methylase/3-demethylubiquinone-9 3-methyltransferase
MTNVDPAEIARFESAAHRWWDTEGEMRPLHDLNPVRLAYIADRAPLEGRRVLDIGCGGGLLAEAMAKRGARVTGLDMAGELLKVAELHALESGIQVDYRLESAEAHAAERPGHYDVVTCMEMLEHVPDPVRILESIAALVKPGGAVFLSTINRTPRAFLAAVVGAEYVLRLLKPGTHTYEKFIRPSELTGWARDAGLRLVDVSGLEYDPFSRTARLTSDARVNYLAHFERPTSSTQAPA